MVRGWVYSFEYNQMYKSSDGTSEKNKLHNDNTQNIHKYLDKMITQIA